MSANRRQFSRIAFHAPGQLVSAGGTDDIAVVDLSLKGALLRRKAPLRTVEVGSSCTLRVRLGELDAVIRMQGAVAHIDGPYLGLACSNIDLDSATHLRRLVELNLAKPQLLERELAALVGEE
jgi:hypothetical protein